MHGGFIQPNQLLGALRALVGEAAGLLKGVREWVVLRVCQRCQWFSEKESKCSKTRPASQQRAPSQNE